MRNPPFCLVLLAIACCGSPDATDSPAKDATTGAETGPREAGASGAGSPEAGMSEAGPLEAGPPRAGSPEAGLPEAGASGSTSEPPACNPKCAAGERCDLVQVTCIRAPCPPLPMCVAASAAVSCDPAKILCRRAAPQCPEGQVPSVSGSCYGPCVPVESCACTEEPQCPNHDSYTCHKSAGHCGPYV
jgi:hypothetical protein